MKLVLSVSREQRESSHLKYMRHGAIRWSLSIFFLLHLLPDVQMLQKTIRQVLNVT